MEVLIVASKLDGGLSSHGALQRQWGSEGDKKIGLRLQQLAAATTLADMRALPGRCHELGGDLKGCLAIDVHHPYRLVFLPTGRQPPPAKADGGLDWDRVDSITVIDIIDY